MNIFILRQNEELGPLSRDDVFSLLLRGEIGRDDRARTEKNCEWRSLDEVMRETAPSVTLPGFVPQPSPSPESSEPNMEAGSPGQPEAFFIWRNENEEGPFSLDETVEFLHQGELAESDYIRRETDAEWYAVADVLSRQAISSDAEPVTPTSDECGRAFAPAVIESKLAGVRSGALSGTTPRFANPAKWILLTGVVGMLITFGAACLLYVRQNKNESSVDATSAMFESQTALAGHAAPVANLTGGSVVNGQPESSPVVQAKLAAALAPTRANKSDNQSSPSSLPQNSFLASTDKPPSAPATSGTLGNQSLASASPSPPHKHTPRKPTLATSHGVAVPPLPDGDKMDLWVAATSKKPRAILTICVDQHPERIARDQVWEKYAIDNQLALAAVSFPYTHSSVIKNGRRFLQAADGSGQLLLNGLNQVFDPSLPIILYGQGAPGTFTMNFARWKPQRLMAWAAYYGDAQPVNPAQSGSASAINTNNPEPIAAKSGPSPGVKIHNAPAIAFVSGSIPAIIACDKNGPRSVVLKGRQFFSVGRLQNAPWTLVALTGSFQDRSQRFENFVKTYMSAVLANSATKAATGSVWVDNIKRDRMSSLDLMKYKADRVSWLPDETTFNEWEDLTAAPAVGGVPTVIEQDVATRNPVQPTLKLYLRLPPGVTDGSELSGVLAYCTWEDNTSDILNKLRSSAADVAQVNKAAALMQPYLAFAEQHNMAVLTWGTVEAWDNTVSTEELERKEQQQFDRNFNLLADAWARGVALLGQKTGIPQSDYLLYGISRGGQWAHRLALRKPGYFLAVHVHIPSTFDTPTAAGKQALWLVTTGEREAGYDRAQRFYHECTALGYPIMFKAIMGIGHADSPIEHALGLKFFEYALSLKADRDAWLQTANDPFKKELNQSPPPAQWLASFHAPPFYGDFLNQDCYSADQSDMIPEALRVPLPTKELADLWNK